LKPVLYFFDAPLLGRVEIPAYFTLLTIGFGLAMWMTWRESKRIKLDPELILDANLWMVVWGIIGARVLHVIAQARKNLQSIEVDVFALQNVLEVCTPEDFSGKTIALINIGANITNVVIVERGTPQLFRDLSLGGFFFTENIRKELSIPFEEAEKLLKGIPGKSATPDQFANLLSMNVRDLLDEIEKTFSFYEASEKRERKIEQIVLSGGLANVQNMVSAFETKFRIKAEVLNPFRNIRVDDKKFDAVYFTDMAPIFGVAVGLATRKVEK